MTSKTFVSGTTIDSAWLNDVNDSTYTADTAPVGSFRASLESSSGSFLVGYLPSGTGAAATDVQSKLRDDLPSLLDFIPLIERAGIKAGTSTFDCSPAANTYFAAHPNGYAPQGTYHFYSAVSRSGLGSMSLMGDGVGITNFVKHGDGDLFVMTNTGPTGCFTFSDFTVAPATSMVSGAAFNLQSDSSIPSVLMSNIFIGTPTSYEFKYGVKIKNCSEARFTNVVCYGLGTTNFEAFNITCTLSGGAIVPRFIGCSVYNAKYAISATNTTNRGIEGLQIYGCDFVGVNTGVLFSNTFGPTYYPSQISIIGGHINASGRCVFIDTATQIFITGALLYSSSATEFVKLLTCSNYNITGNTFIAVGGTANGIYVSTVADPIDCGVISGNLFSVIGNCIVLDASRVLQNLAISGNIKTTGGYMVYVPSGELPSSVKIKNNTLDTDDVFSSISTIPDGGGNWMINLGSNRSPFILLGGALGTVTKMINGKIGDTITLKCDALVTLQHNGINPDGFSLKGFANFTFTAGSIITLIKANGGYWTEISRSV